MNRDVDFKRKLSSLQKKGKPTTNDVEDLCRALEEWAHAPGDGTDLKQAAVQSVQYLNQYEHLRSNESLLRIYTLVGRFSERLGLHGVMDELEKQGQYSTSYKFHLLWAQSHAQKNHAQKFREIRELALRRIVNVTQTDIKDDFKAIADKYLQGQIIDGDSTHPAVTNKSRRQSAVAFIQRSAIQSLPATTSSAKLTSKIVMRVEFIDRVGYQPVSPEEWVAAEYADQNAADDDMDISAVPQHVEDDAMDLEKTVSSLSPAFLPPPRTPCISSIGVHSKADSRSAMSTLAEVSERDSMNEAKRPRVFSPLRPVSESRYSASKVSTDAPASPVSFTENEYKKADAVFYDTVNFGANAPPQNDFTLPVVQSAPDAFEVYEDPEQSVCQTQEQKPRPTVERKPLAEIDAERDRKTEEKASKGSSILDVSAIENDECPNFGKNKVVNIVTSTPFTGAPMATEAAFFGENKKDDCQEDSETAEDLFSNLGFAKRRSVAKPVIPQIAERKPKAEDVTLSTAMSKVCMDDLERTGIEDARPVTKMESMNPWDKNVRDDIMYMFPAPIHRHDLQSIAPRLSRNKDVVLGGEKFYVEEMIGEGGFAKVFKCVGEDNNVVALKYEVPNCAWEMHICDQLKRRLSTSGRGSITKSVMEVTDGYIFSNASILLNEYHPHGTLLDVSNKLRGSCHSQLLLFLGIQIASVLKEVHACGIIHGDVKPDNIVVLSSVDENGSAEEVLSKIVVKFIDWGRAIDISSMPVKEFTGRGGTANFDCPEMLTNRPWNFQTDFFGFIASLQVMGLGRYGTVILGPRNKMDQSLKRRLPCRDVVEALTDRILNIPSCLELPSWDDVIQPMTACFMENFSAAEWRAAARQFNESMKN